MADFVTEQIDSVLELEVLLLLAQSAPQQWSAADLAATLKIDPAWAAEQLARFTSRGILACNNTAPPQCRYAPANPKLDETIRAVADAYATHRVRIIGLIFSKPTSNLKTFADAFRIRKEKE